MPPDSTDTIQLKKQTVALAGAAEHKRFWQTLRHFYRTGEKPESNRPMGDLTSVFKAPFSSLPSAYPVLLGQKEVPFSASTSQYLVEYYLSDYQSVNIRYFKEKLNSLIGALSNLLNANPGENDGNSFDFATELIAFDRLTKMIPQHTGPDLSQSRKNRLTKIFELLKSGLSNYKGTQALLLTTKGKNNPATSDQMKRVLISKERALSEVFSIMQDQLSMFTDLIQAFRMASLEIEDAYDETVHDDYFSHFTWYRLSEEEQSWFRPVVIQLDHQLVMDQLDDLSVLLSTNWPVKLLISNNQLVTTKERESSWAEAAHRYRPELAALALAHRNVATYQLTIADPELLQSVIKDWLSKHIPAVMHLLEPSQKEDISHVKAANYGRFFPILIPATIEYGDMDKKWNICPNPDHDRAWPVMSFQIEDHMQELTFTYADYKAFYQHKVEELMLVSSAYDSEYLVPLVEYLELDSNEVVGKIPYIWLVDPNQVLHRAAIPNVWVVSCQERLDYWKFLQEVARVRSSEQASVGQEEINAVVDHEQLEQVRAEARREAANRLIKELLSEL